MLFVNSDKIIINNIEAIRVFLNSSVIFGITDKFDETIVYNSSNISTEFI